MDRVVRARIVAGLSGAAAVALFMFDQLAAAAGLAALAVTTVLLVTRRESAAGLPDDAAAGAVHALADLARGLRLDGRGILIPGKGDEASILFVPARDARFDEVPPLSGDAVLQREGPGALGARLTPPGAGLEARWRRERGLPQGAGSEEAAQHVNEALTSLGLGSDVLVARGKNALRITYQPGETWRTCEATRTTFAPWHLQGGCPTCSLVMILVARAHQAPVRILDAGSDGGRVTLDLEVGPRRAA